MSINLKSSCSCFILVIKNEESQHVETTEFTQPLVWSVPLKNLNLEHRVSLTRPSIPTRIGTSYSLTRMQNRGIVAKSIMGLGFKFLPSHYVPGHHILYPQLPTPNISPLPQSSRRVFGSPHICLSGHVISAQWHAWCSTGITCCLIAAICAEF